MSFHRIGCHGLKSLEPCDRRLETMLAALVVFRGNLFIQLFEFLFEARRVLKWHGFIRGAVI